MNQSSRLFAAMALLLVAVPAQADIAYETIQYGGTGGREFESECLRGFTKGLSLRAATYIDQVGLRCVDPNTKQVVSLNTRFGGTGGVSYSTTCRTGYVVKGLRGRSATLVDRLQITCVEEADVWRATDTTSESIDYNYPEFGGTGGQYFSVRCGGGDAAVGIHGGSGTYVDRVGLWCKDTGN